MAQKRNLSCYDSTDGVFALRRHFLLRFGDVWPPLRIMASTYVGSPHLPRFTTASARYTRYNTRQKRQGRYAQEPSHWFGLTFLLTILLLMLDHSPIEIKASFSAVSPPPSTTKVLALTKVVKVLSSAPLRILRLKLLKLFKAPRGASGELWMRMADGKLVPLGDIGGADDDKDIDWWLESGSEVVLCTRWEA